jgi:hypothetical protein
MNKEWLLAQLRILADGENDHRSLVAIAAQFERGIDDRQGIPDYLKEAIKKRRHNRNDGDA